MFYKWIVEILTKFVEISKCCKSFSVEKSSKIWYTWVLINFLGGVEVGKSQGSTFFNSWEQLTKHGNIYKTLDFDSKIYFALFTVINNVIPQRRHFH